MEKRKIVPAVAALLALLLCACGAKTGNDGVSVQRADQLSAAAQAGDRFMGVVVSENVIKVQRDSNKTVAECYVSVGQQVAEGEKLFSYDAAAAEIELDRQQLEMDKLQEERSARAAQQAELEQQLEQTETESERVRLTLEINELKTQRMESDYQIAAKEKELARLRDALDHITVVSPVEGTIRQIDEGGESGTYITIQQSGAFKVKGSINEMSLGSGLAAGARVRVISRLDSTQTWMGTVTSVELQSATQDGTDSGELSGTGRDEMTSTSSYPFFVKLDSSEGLLLGQHVYMELSNGEEQAGLWVPQNYFIDMKTDDLGETTAAVWAADSHGKLEKRTVSLGLYDDMTGCFAVVSGLAPEDYVADPADPGCRIGAAILNRDASDFFAQTEDPAPEGEDPAEKDTEDPVEEPGVDDVAQTAEEPTGDGAEQDAAEPTDDGGAQGAEG